MGIAVDMCPLVPAKPVHRSDCPCCLTVLWSSQTSYCLAESCTSDGPVLYFLVLLEYVAWFVDAFDTTYGPVLLWIMVVEFLQTQVCHYSLMPELTGDPHLSALLLL
ncbi:hypothetical protein CHS0354_002656 [Potamilus streckersoni]|uniref:Uncharacterized protein n=1 Tax=Potamilus streckersoni TaxID=2493646 RepID=A0AAE0RVY8_9BIVA|nr:hypothetical protein CHS0354_002656 [Potamilus streckersoni]